MGNTQSKSYKPASFDKDNWHEMPQLRGKTSPDQGLFRLLRNNLTSEHIEQYHLLFHTQDEFQKYLEFVEWRDHEDNIVTTKFLNHEQTKQFCKNNHTAQVYIEHIPVRLSDIQDIPFPENLYVLYSALNGFEKLYQTVGYFHISEQLICMDRDGQVKVWLNPDLSKSHPYGLTYSDQASSNRQTDRLEQQMVNEIVKIIELNTVDDIDATMTFEEYLRQTHKGRGLDFQNAKSELLNYAAQEQTEIPNYFESVIGIFDDGEQYEADEEEGSHQLGSIRYMTEQPKSNTNHQFSEQWHNGQAHYQNNQANAQMYEHEIFQEESKHKPNEAVKERNLERLPSLEKATLDNHFRPFTYAPIATQLQTESQVVKPYRQFTPLQPLQTLPMGSFNSSQINIKFKYQGNASNCRPSFLPQTQYRMTLPSFLPSIAPVRTQHVTGPSSESDPIRQSQAWSKQTRILRTSSLKDLVQNNKLIYFDTRQAYELDPEITLDMFKYLGLQPRN